MKGYDECDQVPRYQSSPKMSSKPIRGILLNCYGV